jgi:hypothetical protein
MHMKSEGGEIGVYLCPEQDEPVVPLPALPEVKVERVDLHNTSSSRENVSSGEESPGNGGGFSLLELEENDYPFTLAADEGLANFFLD